MSLEELRSFVSNIIYNLFTPMDFLADSALNN